LLYTFILPTFALDWQLLIYLNYMLRVKELLKSRGLTAKELASRLGITEAALSSSLSGNPTLDRLNAIADALGVPVTELFVPTPTGTLRCPHCGGVIKIEKGE
jgi:transcriptional regulator with XRE-family HTH domain